MRTRRTWTGTFHCPVCKIEEELREEDALECQECGEQLVPGPLFVDKQGPEEAEETEATEKR